MSDLAILGCGFLFVCLLIVAVWVVTDDDTQTDPDQKDRP